MRRKVLKKTEKTLDFSFCFRYNTVAFEHARRNVRAGRRSTIGNRVCGYSRIRGSNPRFSAKTKAPARVLFVLAQRGLETRFGFAKQNRQPRVRGTLGASRRESPFCAGLDGPRKNRKTEAGTRQGACRKKLHPPGCFLFWPKGDSKRDSVLQRKNDPAVSAGSFRLFCLQHER